MYVQFVLLIVTVCKQPENGIRWTQEYVMSLQFFIFFFSFLFHSIELPCVYIQWLRLNTSFSQSFFSSLSKLCKCVVAVYTMLMKHEYFFVCFNRGIKKTKKAKEKYTTEHWNFGFSFTVTSNQCYLKETIFRQKTKRKWILFICI